MSDIDEKKESVDSSTVDELSQSGVGVSSELEQLELKLPDESAELKDLGLWAGVLILLTLLVYWPATGGRFLWRDGHAVSDNMWVRYPGGLEQSWLMRWEQRDKYPLAIYQPMTATAYWLEYRLGGHVEQGGPIPPAPTPLVFHLANIIFHAGGAVLLWLILRELLVPGAWIIAAIFALHPLNAEPVSWIADQSWVLGGLLFFGSVYLYLRFVKYREKDTADRHNGRPAVDPVLIWGLYSGSVAVFVLAMLANPATAMLPAVLLLMLWWRRRLIHRDYLLLLPLLVVAAGLWLSMGDLTPGGDTPLWHRGWNAQLAAIGSGLFSSMRVVAPFSLKVFHKQWAPAQWWIGGFALACWMAGLACFWVTRDRWGRGLFAATAIYGLVQFSSLNWFDPTRLAAFTDATSYLAGIPIVLLVTVSVIGLLKKARLRATFAQRAVTVCAVVLVALGGMSWARAHVFDNPVTFWQDAVTQNPGSSLALSQLAEELRLRAIEEAGQGDGDHAKLDLTASLDHAQDAVKAEPRNAFAQRTWANVLVAEGDIKAALPHFARAADIQPDGYENHIEFGSALVAIGMFKDAIPQLDAALSMDSTSAMAHRLLGVAYAGLGNVNRAIGEELQSLELNPSDVTARLTLAEEQGKAGQIREAITNYSMSMASDNATMSRPDLWIAIAKLKERQADWAQAVLWYQGALKLDSESAEAKKGIEVDSDKARKAAATRPTTQSTTRAAST